MVDMHHHDTPENHYKRLMDGVSIEVIAPEGGGTMLQFSFAYAVVVIPVCVHNVATLIHQLCFVAYNLSVEGEMSPDNVSEPITNLFEFLFERIPAGDMSPTYISFQTDTYNRAKLVIIGPTAEAAIQIVPDTKLISVRIAMEAIDAARRLFVLATKGTDPDGEDKIKNILTCLSSELPKH